MELPIQVAVVLLVTVAVAGAVVYFSTSVISDAQKEIQEPWKEENPELVIEVADITDNGLKILVEECYQRNEQEALSKELCFVVHGQANHVTLVSGMISGINVEVINPVGNTLYVYYDPAGSKIQITS